MVTRLEGYQLSPQQRVAWNRIATGAVAPTQAFADMDRDSAIQSQSVLQALADQLEILRTVFCRPGGSPVPLQVVRPQSPVRWSEDGLGHPVTGRDVTQVLWREAAAMSHPGEGPNVRFAVVHGTDRSTVVATASPLCADRATLGLLLGATGADGSDLSNLQYADLAEWLREQAPSPAAVPSEPVPLAPPAVQVAHGLVTDVVRWLEDVAAGHGLSTTDLAAAAAMVAAWRFGSNQVDVVMSGRSRSELAYIAGPLAFAVPIVREERAAWRLLDVARAIRDDLDALGDQAAPPPNATAGPLMVGAPPTEALVPGEGRIGFADDPGPAGLSIEVLRHPDEGLVVVEQRRRGGATLQPGGPHVAHVLAAAAEDAARPTWLIPALSLPERDRAVDMAHARRHEPWKQRTVAAAFAATVERDPDKPAVIETTGVTSYAALAERAETVAGALAEHGIRRGDIVAIDAPRSTDAVAAMLGAWSVGAAFLPVSRQWPSHRVEAVMRRSGSAAVLTAHAAELPGDAPAITLPVPRSRYGRAPAGDGLAGNDLAYVLATSGTTGQPKLVGVEHAALANRIAWSQRAYPLRTDDRVLHHAALTFDFALWEIFGPLTAGAGVVVVPEDRSDPLTTLLETQATTPATVIHAVPSLLTRLLEGSAAPLRAARRVLLGGEPLPRSTVVRLLASTGAEVWNQYGPTECTIDVTCHRVGSTEAGSGWVPIGRAIDGVAVHVVDRWGQPTPEGVVGEIAVGGMSVARGYLAEPALTARQFVPDPFGPPGSRLYLTGDLGRRRPDGDLEFVGRIDDQVKIRGFRVEPGEVTATLDEHPAVTDAAVVAAPDGAGQIRLVAFVVAAGSVTAPVLRDHLRQRVPDYMVPAQIVFLQRMPLTGNGKLDRGALPIPRPTRPDLGTAPVAPRTRAETSLAAIWTEVLGIEHVGVDDDFFDLGGHSLLVADVVTRIRERLGVEVTIREIFTHTTIATLARQFGRTDDAVR